jgi:Zinc knuckle
VDIYPVTLVAAINSVTKFHRGTKVSQPTTPSATVYTSLAAVEDKTKGKPRGGRDKKPKSEKGKPNPDSNLGGGKDKDWKSKIKCHNCGKLGHLKKECRGKKKDTPPPTRNASAAIADNDVNNEISFYSTFGQMHDKEDDTSYQERYCNITLTSTPGATSTLGTKIGLPADQNSIQPTTEIMFDTGANGSIMAKEAILASITY